MQHAHRLVAVAFDAIDGFFVQPFGFAGGSESAVIHVAACAARDLADLFGAERAICEAVELLHRGEGDVIDIHVDAHADGVGRHQEVRVAGLIERDLRVACAWTQRAEHHRRAAALAAHKIGDAINVIRRKGDDGGAPGQAGEFLVARISEVAETRAGDEVSMRHEALDRAAHRLRAHEQGFFFAARVQQAIGKDMATLGIGAKLDFIDSEKGHAEIHRHRFDGADEIFRVGRNDLLFAGDQRADIRALQHHDLVVDLAGEKAQWQADHAGFVREHALDRIMRLAGVGGAEDGGHAADAMPLVPAHLFWDHRRNIGTLRRGFKAVEAPKSAAGKSL